MDDPYRWLEDVSGDRALAWVKQQNARSTAELTASPGYRALHDRLLSILDSDDRIPLVAKMGDYYYNFWQDAHHERGLWRRTTLAQYRKKEPAWETVIDLDALAAAEGTRWVWHGADCLEPEYRLCLVSLSPGGSDADVKREFDLVAKRFVDGGFSLPEAKGHAAWVNADTVLVATDFGPGTMTTSGYPRQVREWKRGTPLETARLVYEGQPDDVSVSAAVDQTPGFERQLVQRGITFFTSETWLRTPDGALVKLEVPEDAEVWAHREWILVKLRTDWGIADRTWPGGALLVMPFDAFLAGDRSFQALFTPSPRTSLAGTAATLHTFVVDELDNVRSRLYVWTHSDGKWQRTPMTGLPASSAIGAAAVDPERSDDLWLTVTDYLTPTTLSLADAATGRIENLKELPAYFDVTGLEISQHEATSADGTAIPYFQVSKAGKCDGRTPTLLYGYGGFEISLTPAYSATVGAAWLERGGAYVVANIRGGGEFGPRWHLAALKEKRHKAYEDFAAVARDLVARKVTSARHLGAMGGSNGGLLMGNMLVRYPELFHAIVCQVPLLDMRRFNVLLAGASWMGEYGDPDDPEQWKYIQTFSSYHLVEPGKRYPRTMFLTSTRDDRVHPGHARKMAAKMIDQGHDVLYWENTEGGHGGAATNAERATMWALSWTFLGNELD